MAKRPTIETLGEKGNCVKVKKMMSRIGPVWLAGVRITSDDGKMKMSMPCGKGGVIAETRQKAILQATHEFLRDMPATGFEKAKEVLNKIFEQVTNNPNAK